MPCCTFNLVDSRHSPNHSVLPGVSAYLRLWDVTSKVILIASQPVSIFPTSCSNLLLDTRKKFQVLPGSFSFFFFCISLYFFNTPQNALCIVISWGSSVNLWNGFRWLLSGKMTVRVCWFYVILSTWFYTSLVKAPYRLQPYNFLYNFKFRPMMKCNVILFNTTHQTFAHNLRSKR